MKKLARFSIFVGFFALLVSPVFGSLSLSVEPVWAGKYPRVEFSEFKEGEGAEYVRGSLLVKFKKDPELRPSGWLERKVLGRPKIMGNQASVNRLSKEAAVENADKVLEDPVPVYRLKVSEDMDVEELAERFAAEAAVEYAEPNYLVRAFWSPNDPYYSHQWNFRKVESEAAWDISRGGVSGVTVAVVDTGIAYEDYVDPNPALCYGGGSLYNCIDAGTRYSQTSDFSGTDFVPGYDFINDDSHPNDDFGHGTHVAATVAESTDNARKAAGLAFEVSIMPVKVLVPDGQGGAVGDSGSIADGIDYAWTHGADVINLSLGLRADSSVIREAVTKARNAGVVVVASTGNGSGRNHKEPVAYPAAYSSVIAVGASRFDDRRANYSNFGSNLDLLAPGGQLINDAGNSFLDQDGDQVPDGILQETVNPGNPSSGGFDPTRTTALTGVEPNTGLHCVICSGLRCRVDMFGCGLFVGTSMAAPHVSAAALVLSQDSSLSPSEVRTVLLDNARDVGPSGFDQETGNGVLDLEAALGAVGPQATLKTVILKYGTSDTDPDLNGDGLVNGMDFGYLVKTSSP